MAMLPHDELLTAINTLYAQVVDLPDELPIGGVAANSVVEPLHAARKAVSGLLEQASAWEARHSKAAARLAREALAVRQQRVELVRRVKHAKRTLADEAGAASRSPLLRAVAKLSQLARLVSSACPPEDIEVYVADGEDDSSGKSPTKSTMTLYTNLFVLDLQLEEVVSEKVTGSAGSSLEAQEAAGVRVVCSSANLQFVRGEATVSDAASDTALAAATTSFVAVSPGVSPSELAGKSNHNNSSSSSSSSRLRSALLALARTGSAAAVLAGSGEAAAAAASDSSNSNGMSLSSPRDKGGSAAESQAEEVKWLGPATDVQVALGTSLAQLTAAGCTSRPAIEGVELDLWVAAASNGSSSSESNSNVAPSGGVVGRLAPALWRRRPVVALALDPPLPMAAAVAQRLCALSLGYGFNASAASGTQCLPSDVWNDLHQIGCFEKPGIDSGDASGGTHIGDMSSNTSGIVGAIPRPVRVATGWLHCGENGKERAAALHGSAATVGPQDVIVQGSTSTSSKFDSSPQPTGASSILQWPRVTALPGKSFVVLHWLPVAVVSASSAQDKHQVARGDALPQTVAYLQAYAAAHSQGAFLVGALEKASKTGQSGNNESEEELVVDNESCVSWTAMPVEMPLVRNKTAASHGNSSDESIAISSAAVQPVLLISLCALPGHINGSNGASSGRGALHTSRRSVRSSSTTSPSPVLRLLVGAPLPPGFSWALNEEPVPRGVSQKDASSSSSFSGRALEVTGVEGGDAELDALMAATMSEDPFRGDCAVKIVSSAAKWLLTASVGGFESTFLSSDSSGTKRPRSELS